MVTARRTDHRTTPSTPPSLPPSRDVKRPPVRIGWNRSIDRSDRQTDRQTDGFGYGYQKKTLTGDDSNPLEIRGFFLSIDPIDRFPIETRDLRGTRSIRFDPIDSTRSIRFGIDSISISIRSDARIDRWFLSIERPPGCGSTDGATVQANRRSVGRSIRVRSLSTSSDGYTDRTDRYRETPTRGRAGETDRYDSSSDSSSDSTDGRTDARTTRIHPSIGTHHPSGRPPRRYEQRYLLSLTKSVCRSVGAFGPPRAESSVGRSVGFARRVRVFVLVEGGGGEIGGEGGRVVGRSRADANEDNRGRGGCLTEVGLRLRASGRSVDRFDSIRPVGDVVVG